MEAKTKSTRSNTAKINHIYPLFIPHRQKELYKGESGIYKYSETYLKKVNLKLCIN